MKAGSAREALRARHVEQTVRKLCKQIEKEREGTSFAIRGENEYPRGHKVFIRIRVEGKQTGFYVIPESEYCLVCFFRDYRQASLSRRLRRLFGLARDYDEFRVHRRRKTLHSAGVPPSEFSVPALSDWLEYACSSFKRSKKPDILKAR